MTRLIILVIAISASAQVTGAVSSLNGTINRVLQDNSNYGFCMARVSPGPETVANCKSNYVTFSCSGDFNSKADGNLKFQSAQLGLLSGLSVYLEVDDAKKHNGYCFARRIDVYK